MSSAECVHRRESTRQLLLRLLDSVPVRSRIAKWLYRHSAQSVCAWDARFAPELQTPAFAPREVLAGKEARQLARELLAMTQEELSAAFEGSPMKRAKLRGLKRNAAVVLGNPSLRSGQAALAEDVAVLARALDDAEPMVREHAAWAVDSIRARGRAV